MEYYIIIHLLLAMPAYFYTIHYAECYCHKNRQVFGLSDIFIAFLCAIIGSWVTWVFVYKLCKNEDFLS